MSTKVERCTGASRMVWGFAAGMMAIFLQSAYAAESTAQGYQLFDSDWRFLRADAPGAEAPAFDDSSWRVVDIPHDWSIEDLPPAENTFPSLSVVTGRWRFQKGDDAAWKASDFKDDDWQVVRLPAPWEDHSDYSENNVYGWFRRTIEIPEDLKDQDFDLLLGYIDDVDEVWLNGKRIGGTGSFPPNYQTAWESERRYRVPASLLRGDGSDVVAIRVYDESGGGGIYQASADSVQVGPFNSAASAGGGATGFVVGGTGWYRKHFTLSPEDAGRNVSICFDGVYMNSDVWLNGHHLGNYPHGYTPFVYDLTPYLKPAGQENVIAVRVRNVGENSRWYTGSGIFRHVRLAVADSVNIPFWGVDVQTPEVSKASATIKVATTIINTGDAAASIQLRTRLVAPDGNADAPMERTVQLAAGEQQEVELVFSVKNPVLWSLDDPSLYCAEVALLKGDETLDCAAQTFGIRTLSFTEEKGFQLNGERVELKGGNMHHDNGPLGSATIDRAEERRVQLMKEYGFNAIRTAHNPASPQFLDACDRLGVLVIDEAFDMWAEPKKPDDYHLYFDEWGERDIETLVLRDRNHPSVIMWSIGNEIPERADPSGVATAAKLAAAVRRLDLSRPVTAGVCGYWDRPNSKWTDLDPAFESLDVGGYNYQLGQYIPDHERFPDRVMYGSETYPNAVYDAWQLVKNHSWVIGDFVWAAWDYIGETGLGGATGNGEPNPKSFPWFNAYCGDIDLCGFKKAPLYYREVVWGESQINMAVHDGHQERVAYWGWPDDRQSWTWPGLEGQELDVKVYSSCASVRLELNGEEIAVKPVGNKMTVRFKVAYEPGELRAVGLSEEGTPVASTQLRTTGKPSAIRLTADRSTIRAERNDLSYVTVEIVDDKGEVVPNGVYPIEFTVAGGGQLVATGSGCPNDASSFQTPLRNSWRGRCLAIVRPSGDTGTITLKAAAEGLKGDAVVIRTEDI